MMGRNTKTDLINRSRNQKGDDEEALVFPTSNTASSRPTNTTTTNTTGSTSTSMDTRRQRHRPQYLHKNNRHHSLLLLFRRFFQPLQGWLNNVIHEFRTEDPAFRLGVLRIVFYSFFYYIAQKRNSSPLANIDCYEVYSPELFRTPAAGVFQHFTYYIPPRYLRIVNNVLHISWWCCILGVATRYAQIVTAILLLFFHGYTWEMVSYAHGWFLPCYVSVALCFLPKPTRLSVDSMLIDKYYIKKKRKKEKDDNDDDERRSTTKENDDATATCYWLILIFTVYFYFAAGMTKLFTSGFQWLDGASIAYEMSYRYDGPGKALLMSSFFTKVSAFGAIFAEVGAPLALINQKMTKSFLILWSVMHVLIKFMLGPYYFQNVNCFLWLFVMERPKNIDKRTSQKLLMPTVLFLFSCVVGQVVYWPITNVYMYSPYFNLERGIYANHPEADYLSREGLQRLAVGFQDYPSVPDMMEYSGNHMILYHSYKENGDGDNDSDIMDDYGNMTGHRDQRRRRKKKQKKNKKKKVESLGVCRHKQLTHGHYRDIMRAGFTNETVTAEVLHKMQSAACQRFRPRGRETSTTATKIMHSLKLVWEYKYFTTDLGEIEFECL